MAVNNVSPNGKVPVGKLVNVVKAYPMGNREYIALRGVNLTLYAGEFTAINTATAAWKSRRRVARRAAASSSTPHWSMFQSSSTWAAAQT